MEIFTHYILPAIVLVLILPQAAIGWAVMVIPVMRRIKFASYGVELNLIMWWAFIWHALSSPLNCGNEEWKLKIETDNSDLAPKNSK